MHYKTLFSLFLFSCLCQPVLLGSAQLPKPPTLYNNFFQAVLLGPANYEKKINELLTKPSIEILKEKPFNIHLSNAIIAKMPKSGNINDEQKKYIKLLPKCSTVADGYEECITNNIKLIMDELTDTLTYENIVDIESDFNAILSRQIVNYMNNQDCGKSYNILLLCCRDAGGYNDCIEKYVTPIMDLYSSDNIYDYISNRGFTFNEQITSNIINCINKIQENDLKKKYIILLLICDSRTNTYSDYVDNNIDLIMEALSDKLHPQNILRKQNFFNIKISKNIVNYISDKKSNIVTIKEALLLLYCQIDINNQQNKELVNKYQKLLANSWKNTNIQGVPKPFQKILKNKDRFTDTELIEAKEYLIHLIKTNYIKRDGVSHKILGKAGVLIALAMGGGLTSWYCDKPYIQHILAGACLGVVVLKVASIHINKIESKTDIAEVEKILLK
jgi:hypothetical protein